MKIIINNLNDEGYGNYAQQPPNDQGYGNYNQANPDQGGQPYGSQGGQNNFQGPQQGYGTYEESYNIPHGGHHYHGHHGPHGPHFGPNSYGPHGMAPQFGPHVFPY